MLSTAKHLLFRRRHGPPPHHVGLRRWCASEWQGRRWRCAL